MASSLRPQFFCTRPNGTLSPLIAVDDLPSHISIRGVPRVLSPNDTQGMTSLGTVDPRAQSYVVEGMSPTLTRPSSANAAAHRTRDYDLQASLMRMAADESTPASQRMAANALLQQGIAQNWCVASPSSNGWLVPSTTSSGGSRQGGHYNSKKEFCSYWIRHGECDYQQQGCLYKHEMPSDPGTLEKLGLRDIPRWYREKYGIPSLLPNGHAHPRSHIAHSQSWKDEGSDHGPIKAIQYPSRLENIGTVDVSESEKPSKHKSSNYLTSQNSPMAPGHSRGVYISSTGSPRTSGNQRHGPRHANKKIDLLSFDPLPEYSSLDALARSVNNLNYPDTRENAPIENVDRTQREDMIRNLQSLMPPTMMPNSDYVPAFETHPTQSRSKKTPKSRRLYQPRSDVSLEKADLDSFRTYHARATASSSAASAVSKDTAGSLIASPSAGGPESTMVSSSPARGISPSAHSGTSLSSESSPRGVRTKYHGKDSKGLPAPIGSNKSQRKRSDESSSDDYYSMSLDYGK